MEMNLESSICTDDRKIVDIDYVQSKIKVEKEKKKDFELKPGKKKSKNNKSVVIILLEDSAEWKFGSKTLSCIHSCELERCTQAAYKDS